jgi:hypothetical protein
MLQLAYILDLKVQFVLDIETFQGNGGIPFLVVASVVFASIVYVVLLYLLLPL